MTAETHHVVEGHVEIAHAYNLLVGVGGDQLQQVGTQSGVPVLGAVFQPLQLLAAVGNVSAHRVTMAMERDDDPAAWQARGAPQHSHIDHDVAREHEGQHSALSIQRGVPAAIR